MRRLVQVSNIRISIICACLQNRQDCRLIIIISSLSGMVASFNTHYTHTPLSCYDTHLLLLVLYNWMQLAVDIVDCVPDQRHYCIQKSSSGQTQGDWEVVIYDLIIIGLLQFLSLIFGTQFRLERKQSSDNLIFSGKNWKLILFQQTWPLLRIHI